VRQWWIDSKGIATLKLKKIKIRHATSTAAGSLGDRGKFQIPPQETSWMIPVSSSTVIIILIAKLPLLYHKPKNTRILH
jgi:hypothetical protein